METKILLPTILGVVLIITGSLLIIGDSGSCPATVATPIGTCYHLLFGFLPMYPTGWASAVIGIILLIVAFVLSRKR